MTKHHAMVLVFGQCEMELAAQAVFERFKRGEVVPLTFVKGLDSLTADGFYEFREHGWATATTDGFGIHMTDEFWDRVESLWACSCGGRVSPDRSICPTCSQKRS